MTLVPAAARPATQPISGYHQRRGLHPVDQPHGLRPYDVLSTVPEEGDGLVDSHGVRMYQVPGSSRLHNHPVLQSAYAIRSLASYDRTLRPVHLKRAIAQANRLIAEHRVARGAWWYPYDFDFAVHDDQRQILHAPWYSAMAQGRALTLFSRLYERTGDDRWRLAADKTFVSVTLPPMKGQPFVTWVDKDGHLWLDEYPRPGVTNGERVFNGHVYAAFGVYDYWRITRDPEALSIFTGAATTVRETILTEFRRPGAPSVYSLLHRKPTQNYHPVHIQQLNVLWRITLDEYFKHAATVLREDYWPY